MVFDFAVVLARTNRPVELEIYDLSGRLVRRLVERRGSGAGRYRIEWDGMDESGALAPAGLYVARLGLDADTEGAGLEKEHILESIALAY